MLEVRTMAMIGIEAMARELANEAMETIVYGGRTLREWIDIIAKNQEIDHIIKLQEKDAKQAEPLAEHVEDTTFISVKDVDEWRDRIILDEGDKSKRCKVYYADALEKHAYWVHCKGRSNL